MHDPDAILEAIQPAVSLESGNILGIAFEGDD
jgi:hypothetical protein